MSRLVKRIIIGVIGIVALAIALAIASRYALRPGMQQYQAASKQADDVARNYNDLRKSFTDDFLSTDAATKDQLAPIQKQLDSTRSAANTLASIPAFVRDSKLKTDYNIFRPKLDNALAATQDLINSKEFASTTIYPTCGNSKDFKLRSNIDGIATELAPCRKVLDGLDLSAVKSTDVRRNITEYRAGLTAIDLLAAKGDAARIGFAVLATIDTKRQVTDFASNFEKQNVPAVFKILRDDISAKVHAK